MSSKYNDKAHHVPFKPERVEKIYLSNTCFDSDGIEYGTYREYLINTRDKLVEFSLKIYVTFSTVFFGFSLALMSQDPWKESGSICAVRFACILFLFNLIIATISNWVATTNAVKQVNFIDELWSDEGKLPDNMPDHDSRVYNNRMRLNDCHKAINFCNAVVKLLFILGVILLIYFLGSVWFS
ncbi:hypothetical protein C4J81_16485 [Deltaproteobacteria bacterium Smac51]|nr:hypothetical protein C4J81_16485 [Deltaproteobacteria bacterium Smac51]